MSFRTYQALLVVAALMAGFLVALPIWDWWTYRQSGAAPALEYGAPAGTEAPPLAAAAALPAAGSAIRTVGMAAPQVRAQAGNSATRIQPVVLASVAGAAARPAPAPTLRGPGPGTAATAVTGPSETAVPSGRAVPTRPATAQNPGSSHSGTAGAAGVAPPASSGNPLSWVRSLFVQAPPVGPTADGPPQPAESPAPRNEEEASDPTPDPDLFPETGTPRLSLVPSAATVAPGHVVSVRVVLTGGQMITSVPFHLKFDPALLEFLGARTGSAFLSSSLEPLLLASVNPERPGDLAVGLALIGDSRSFTGSGSLVVLDFRATGRGRSDLTFESSSVRGATSEPLPAEFANTTIQID